jgi:hypothetical protein
MKYSKDDGVSKGNRKISTSGYDEKTKVDHPS